MAKQSAGILLWRRRDDQIEVLLAHPGGPYWEGLDDAGWSIPKGVHEPGEDEYEAAIREFNEETGANLQPDKQQLKTLGVIKNKKGKRVEIFALEGDFNLQSFSSNYCTIEWPHRSGQFQEIPEMDKAGWFELSAARRKIFPSQEVFLDRLMELAQDSDH